MTTLFFWRQVCVDSLMRKGYVFYMLKYFENEANSFTAL